MAAFDKVFAEAQTNKKAKAEDDARVKAKREASVISGANTNRTTAPVVDAAPKSVFEAFEQAKRTLNL